MLKLINVQPKVNAKWRRFYGDRCLSVSPSPIVRPDDKIFTMGSCFAREVRFALRDQGMEVGPDLSGISFEDGNYVIDNLPHEEHLNYYNSFTIRQEFEQIAGKWTQSPDDYWELTKGPVVPDLRFQDPYKRLTFGRTPEDLMAAVTMVNDALVRSVRQSRVFFFTLGMTEVFRKRDNGLIAGQKPAYLGGGGQDETAFVASDFKQNFENLVEIRNIIKSLNPDAHIVVTVSPVPLERTFSGNDIVVANIEGKSTLRTVAAEFSGAHDDVTYFPSYEMVTMAGESAFQARDLRHVDPGLVKVIMGVFLAAHVVGHVAPS